MAPAVLSVSLTNDAAPTVPVITKARGASPLIPRHTSSSQTQANMAVPSANLTKHRFVPCGPGVTSYYDLPIGGIASR